MPWPGFEPSLRLLNNQNLNLCSKPLGQDTRNNTENQAVVAKLTSLIFFFVHTMLLLLDYKEEGNCMNGEIYCLNEVCVDQSNKCILDFDKHGYIKGCRDVTHLRDCGKFKAPTTSTSTTTTTTAAAMANLHVCAFRCLISGPQILNLRSQNQIRWKLLQREPFLTMFLTMFLSTSPHYSLPSNNLC